jgi:hypothetical protein
MPIENFITTRSCGKGDLSRAISDLNGSVIGSGDQGGIKQIYHGRSTGQYCIQRRPPIVAHVATGKIIEPSCGGLLLALKGPMWLVLGKIELGRDVSDRFRGHRDLEGIHSACERARHSQTIRTRVIQIDKDEASESGRISPLCCGNLSCTSERFLPFYHCTQQQDKLCLYLHTTMLLKSQIITRLYRLVTSPATDNRLFSTCGTIQQWTRPDMEAKYHHDP